MDDTKEPLLPPPSIRHDAVDTQHVAMHRQKRKSTLQLAAAVLLLAVFWWARTWSCDMEHTESHTQVPLEVHIMYFSDVSPLPPNTKLTLSQVQVPRRPRVP
jgi:hypothetical protein